MGRRYWRINNSYCGGGCIMRSKVALSGPEGLEEREIVPENIKTMTAITRVIAKIPKST